MDRIALNLSGNDTGLETDGDSRIYWYSFMDMNKLLESLRREYFVTEVDDLNRMGEPLQPNNKKIILTNVILDQLLQTYMEKEIQQFLKLFRVTVRQIIIPLFINFNHCRVLRVLIDHEEKVVSILIDDPQGDVVTPEVSKGYETALMPSLRLLGCSNFTIQMVIKNIRQQPIGNSWDCGPIILTNIRDYIDDSLYSIPNDAFEQYTIPDVLQNRSNHYDMQIEMIRKEHLNTRKVACSNPLLMTPTTMGENLKSEALKMIKSIDPNEKYTKILGEMSRNMLLQFIDYYYSLEETESTERRIEESLELCIPKIEDTKRLSSGSDETSLLGENKTRTVKNLEDEMDQIKIVNSSVKFNLSSAYFDDLSKYYWVDKSLLIKEVIDLPERSVAIITRPRRFGKSSNLSLLQAFFSVEVDDHGNLSPNEDRDMKFQELLIGRKHFDLVTEHRGKYPCILLDLSSIEANSEVEFKDSIKALVSNLYYQHKYLLNSNKLFDYQKCNFRSLMEGKQHFGAAKKALVDLTLYLAVHFDKNVYVFVDEYDQSMVETLDETAREWIKDFLAKFLGSAFKNNQYLEKAIIIGILPIPSIFASRLNNATFHTVLDDDCFSPYFGFSEEEMIQLYQDANVKSAKIHRKIKEYYGGYCFGKHEYYNPFSVAHCFTNLRIESYWPQKKVTIANGIALKSVQPSEDLFRVGELLVSDFEYYKEVKQFRDLLFARKLDETKFSRTNTFWALLIHSGYITVRTFRNNTSHEGENQPGSVCIGESRIPNGEIKEEWIESILEWLTVIKSEDISTIKLNLDESSSLITVQELLNQCCLDRIATLNERIFHTLIDSIYFLTSKSHAIAEEKKASKGGGRLDTIWYPIQGKSNRVIIVEYKYLKETEGITVEEKMKDAYFQIFQKRYLHAVLLRYLNLKLTHFEEIEIRPIVIVEGRGDSKTVLHWPHEPYLLTIRRAFVVNAFAQLQSETQWVDIKKGEIQQFNKNALATETEWVEIEKDESQQYNKNALVSAEPSAKPQSTLPSEQEDFLQRLPKECKGTVRKVLSKAQGEDIWNKIKEAPVDELMKVSGIKRTSVNAILAAREESSKKKKKSDEN